MVFNLSFGELMLYFSCY